MYWLRPFRCSSRFHSVYYPFCLLQKFHSLRVYLIGRLNSKIFLQSQATFFEIVMTHIMWVQARSIYTAQKRNNNGDCVFTKLDLTGSVGKVQAGSITCLLIGVIGVYEPNDNDNPIHIYAGPGHTKKIYRTIR